MIFFAVIDHTCMQIITINNNQVWDCLICPVVDWKIARLTHLTLVSQGFPVKCGDFPAIQVDLPEGMSWWSAFDSDFHEIFSAAHEWTACCFRSRVAGEEFMKQVRTMGLNLCRSGMRRLSEKPVQGGHKGTVFLVKQRWPVVTMMLYFILIYSKSVLSLSVLSLVLIHSNLPVQMPEAALMFSDGPIHLKGLLRLNVHPPVEQQTYDDDTGGIPWSQPGLGCHGTCLGNETPCGI